MAALAAGGDGVGANALAELDHRDETVAVIAVPALRPRLLLGAERCERAVAALGERHRKARFRVAVRRVDRRRGALDAVDLAPRHLPAAKVAVQASDRGGQRVELLLRSRVARQ